MPDLQNAGFFRRLAAAFYDSILVFSVLFFAGIVAMAAVGAEPISPGHYGVRVYFALVCFLFFGGFWTHGGQTLGMRTWRLRVTNLDGSPINWKRAALRFVAAAFSWGLAGVGVLWILVDKQKRAVHDIISGTRVIQLEAQSRKRKPTA